jgi:hypothetical protein
VNANADARQVFKRRVLPVKRATMCTLSTRDKLAAWTGWLCHGTLDGTRRDAGELGCLNPCNVRCLVAFALLLVNAPPRDGRLGHELAAAGCRGALRPLYSA